MIALLLVLAAQVTWQDGSHSVTATRVPSAVPGFSAAELRYSTGQHTRAHFNDHLIMQPVDGKAPAFALHGLRPLRALMPSKNLWLVESLDGRDALDTMERLAAEHAEKHFSVVTPDLHLQHARHAVAIPPNDPRYGGQWYLNRLHMEDAWRISSGSPATTIVVIDNGCDPLHPDLVGKLDEGYDAVDDDNAPGFEPGVNGNNHGTACASLVAASTDNGEGIAGTCPECRLRCVRLLSDNPQGVPLSADVASFDFAFNTNAAVVSNSWGFVDAIPVPNALKLAIEQVVDNGRDGKGALVLFAAGNENRIVGENELQGVRGVICIGAITLYEDATSFTNRGPTVDIVAPTGTLAADIAGPDGDDDGDYTARFGGTSSACPVAAGVAGLLVSAAPGLTGPEISAFLVSTARQSPYATPDGNGHDEVFGYGVMAPAVALRRALNLPDPVDAGVTLDAGSTSQGAGGDAPPSDEPKGCACTGSDAPSVALILVAASMLRRRRR